MFENWTKRRNEQVKDDSFVAEATARRRAELGRQIREFVEQGRHEDALAFLTQTKLAELRRLLPAENPDETTYTRVDDEIAFLNELEANLKTVTPRKAA